MDKNVFPPNGILEGRNLDGHREHPGELYQSPSKLDKGKGVINAQISPKMGKGAAEPERKKQIIRVQEGPDNVS